jgi:hypothetical protein
LKGFVVIESASELDIVAVYTVAGSTGQVETLFIERVSSRSPQAAGKPDLIPLNPQPAAGKFGFCRRDPSGKLIVTIKNQGVASAGASHTTIKFVGGQPVTVNTPAIAGGAFFDHLVTMPASCFHPNCLFAITADSAAEVDESDEGNNIADGMCLG